jgi:osmotically-inducible protein OsmY
MRRHGALAGIVQRITPCVLVAALVSDCRADDPRIEQRLLERLAADPVTAPLHLSIETQHRVAIVSGIVTTHAEEQHALEVVSGTDGITGAVNHLRFSDDGLVRTVKTAFAADAAVAQVPVSVSCTLGEITLRSNQTNAQERKRMVEIASAIDGVVHVVDEMK